MVNKDDIISAFDKFGVFKGDNWNDPYINFLRNYVEENNLEIYNNDEYCAVIPFMYKGERPIFIILQWYKHRGRTQQAYVIRCSGQETHTYPLTFKITIDFIERLSKIKNVDFLANL